MRERERKLALPGRFLMPELRLDGAAVEVVSLPSQDLRATYYDTADLRLARHDVTLRMRTGEAGIPPWTLKLPAEESRAGELNRDELQFDGPPRDPPAGAKSLVTAYARSEPLAAVATLRTRRHRWSVRRDDRDVALIFDDEVSVLEGRRVVSRFRELEVEAIDEQAPLEELAAQLRAAGAIDAEPVPKVVRALGSRATAAPDGVGPLTPTTMADAVAVAIADGLRRITAADPLARLGAEEGVHQLRVGFRRLRSDLRTLDAVVQDSWASRLIPRIRRLGGVVGEVRDLDVLARGLRRDGITAEGAVGSLLRDLDERREAALARLRTVLDEPAYAALLDELVAAIEQPPTTRGGTATIERRLPGMVLGSWRRLERRAEPLTPDAPDVAFHDARVAAKRVRYGAELAARLLPGDGGRGAAQLAEQLGTAQEQLGTIQDAAVARAALEAWLGTHDVGAEAAFEAGRAAERIAGRATEARAAFVDHWRSLRRKRLRQWATS